MAKITLDALKATGSWLLSQYQRIEDYFTSGSFGVRFYPFLMYPCVRHSVNGIVRLISILSVFIALYYFFAEFITILFSDISLSAYTRHTVLELLQPAGTIIDGKEIHLSPLYFSMKVAFLLQGCLLFFIYCIGVTQITSRRFRLLGMLFSLLFSCGAMLIFNSQGGKYTVGGLQNTGASLTYLCGNLTMIASGLGIIQPHLKKLKRYSLIAGSFGIIAISATLFIELPYLALLERLSLYSLFVWEVAIGFAILNKGK
ncbi:MULTISPECIES: hypothetical protein [Glaesserella]|uniref:DUF998 domain-containing protein n=1 Tax=Glaesserella australis TaxID=2094024 RepID=A0A328C535_9PAST|nr:MULTISPECIES: hypothetical protein [Glaesserella]AUI65439.1 hypothetical protein CJD39_02075 [Glaesserella sp. 15-184]RAL19634.1 hypothetical protein C5N92_01160 [Glaesserella australis]